MKIPFWLPLIFVFSLPAWANEATPFCSDMSKSAQKKFNVVAPMYDPDDSVFTVAAGISNGKGKAGLLGVFFIDTGADYTSITPETASALGLDLEQAEQVKLNTANGSTTISRVTIESMSFGGFTAKNLKVTVFPLPDNFMGLIGLDILSHFTVIIDFFNKQLLFKCFP